ncbi:MAG: LysM peptidoglycan-binding domain-containing protein [Pseudomonadota bacterium]
MKKLMNFDVRARLFALAGVVAAAAAGCASVPSESGPRYSAGHYTGAEGLYSTDEVAQLRLPAQYDSQGNKLEFAKLEGIAGARQAHRLYGEAVAEQLDGRCENFVAIRAGESLAEISEYCDVPVATLIDFNPAVENPYLVQAGQIVEVPVSRNAVGLSAIGADVADLYTVRAGDTLNKVAYRFNVSSDAIIAMNPNVDWTIVKPGDRLRLPTKNVGSAPRPQTGIAYGAPAYQGQPTTGFVDPNAWQGYSGLSGSEADPSAADFELAKVMPYQLQPVSATLRDGAPNVVNPGLKVNKGAVDAGRSIEVSLDGLPAGTEVTFYRGKTAEDMVPGRAVVAGSDGVARKSFRTNDKTSDPGGFVFRATRNDTGEAYYSERVGVVTLKQPDELIERELTLDEELALQEQAYEQQQLLDIESQRDWDSDEIKAAIEAGEEVDDSAYFDDEEEDDE